MLNLFVLQGRLTHDPELKESDNGMRYSRFSIAVQRNFSKEKEADFFNIVSFGKTAEFVEKYIKKGQQVVVMGNLQMSSYEKEGVTTKKIDLIAKEINFASSKSEMASESSNNLPSEEDIEADLPF